MSATAAPTAPDLTPAITALEQQLGILFASARTLMKERAEAMHPSLTAGSFIVLTVLVRSGPQHAGSLAAALSMDKSVVSRTIKQLTDLGLAERRADPTDGRAFFVAATPQAVRKVAAMRDSNRMTLHRFLSTWPADDVAQLTALLARLNDGPPEPQGAVPGR